MVGRVAVGNGQGSAGSGAEGVRTYVLDTSVLLADPSSLRRFEEHDVVIPVVVLTELEEKRHPRRAGLGGS